MKIIKIAEEKTLRYFFDLDERRKLEKMDDQTYKKTIVEYYQKYAHQSYAIDAYLLNIMKEFKNDDFVISLLYNDLEDKMALT